jgi:TRAP-type C4-dicarboxylate transport system substrate-binding protein
LERADIAKLDSTVSATLTSQGMTINPVDIEPFKEAVRAAGLYAQAKTQYGADAFAMLERTVGRLS